MKKTIFIVLGLFALLFIIFEIGIVDFSIYRSNFSSHRTQTWRSNSSLGRFTDVHEQISLPNKEIVIKYDNKEFGSTHDTPEIVIDISDVDLGHYKIPFFKKSTIKISRDLAYNMNGKTPNLKYDIHLEGSYNYELNYTIIGLCSHKKAKELILDKLLDENQKNISEGINKQLSNEFERMNK